MAFNFMLPLRIAQVVLALLVLALNAYVASLTPEYFYTAYNSSIDDSYHWATYASNVNLLISADAVNFLIFAAVWTAVIVVPALILVPRFYPKIAHPYAIVAVEALTMLFWFAGFIAQAVLLRYAKGCTNTGCQAARAAVAFAAFEWVLFTVTAVMAVMHILRSRKGATTTTPAAKTDPPATTQV